MCVEVQVDDGGDGLVTGTPEALCQVCASVPQRVGMCCFLSCVFVIYTDVQTELEAGYTPLEVPPIFSHCHLRGTSI